MRHDPEKINRDFDYWDVSGIINQSKRISLHGTFQFKEQFYCHLRRLNS